MLKRARRFLAILFGIPFALVGGFLEVIEEVICWIRIFYKNTVFKFARRIALKIKGE